MADPVTLQTLLTYLTLISVPVGVFYHIMTLRNTRKNQELQLETRQAQLMMQLYDTYSSPEFSERAQVIYEQEWTDFDDFNSKYGPEANPDAHRDWTSMARFMNGVGVLLRKGLINVDLVEELLSNIVFLTWIKMSPIVYARREKVIGVEFEGHGQSKKYSAWSGFEYLYTELRKKEQEHLVE